MKKIYCVYCGSENPTKNTKCKKCNKTLNPKENLWWDYIYDHIKDDLQGNVTDKIISLITNYVKSHLYGTIMTILILATATTGIVNVVKNNNVPSYIEEVVVNNNIRNNSNNETKPIIPTEIDFNGVFTTGEWFNTWYYIFNDNGTGFQITSSENNWHYAPFTWRKEGATIYFKEAYEADAKEQEVRYEITGKDKFRAFYPNMGREYKKVVYSDLPFNEENGMYQMTIVVPIEYQNIKEGYYVKGTVNNENSFAIKVESANRQALVDNLNNMKIVVDCSTYDYEWDEQMDHGQEFKYTAILPDKVTNITYTDNMPVNLDKR